MMGAMVLDSAEGELWLATRWKSTGGDEERWKACGFEGWGVEEAENICRTEGECGDEPSEEMAGPVPEWELLCDTPSGSERAKCAAPHTPAVLRKSVEAVDDKGIVKRS
jgi:hypothetical protein